MPALLIRHKVTNYDTWRQVFDEDAETRCAYGSLGWRVLRNDVDPSEIWILLEWDDSARARLFAQSDDLNDVMVRAGVADRPDYWCLEESNRPSR